MTVGQVIADQPQNGHSTYSQSDVIAKAEKDLLPKIIFPTLPLEPSMPWKLALMLSIIRIMAYFQVLERARFMLRGNSSCFLKSVNGGGWHWEPNRRGKDIGKEDGKTLFSIINLRLQWARTARFCKPSKGTPGSQWDFSETQISCISSGSHIPVEDSVSFPCSHPSTSLVNL